uniref:Uncharacterized protein n=1 Tax=Arundo donax TaxID=35708 RepID=A0A0A9EKK2_ARUDO
MVAATLSAASVASICGKQLLHIGSFVRWEEFSSKDFCPILWRVRKFSPQRNPESN